MDNMFGRLASKAGMGLSTVLGTVVFVTAVAVTIFSFTYNQTNNVSRSIIDSEEYKSAVIAVDTTAQLIKNRTDMNATNFESILIGIQDYLDSSTWGQDIVISYDLATYVITITHPIVTVSNQDVTSYLSPSNMLMEGSMPVTLEEQTDLMSYMPSVEPTTEEEYGEVASELSSNFLDYYLDEYTTTDPDTITGSEGTIATVVEDIVSSAALDTSFILYNPGTRTISYKVNKVNYSELAYHMASSTTLSSTNPQYVNGSLNIAAGQTLTVPNGQALFINGNLLMEGAATLNGNVFVRGNIVIYGNNSSLFATLYSGGYVYSTQNLLLGSVSRPTFIFSNSFVQFANISDQGVVYIFAQEFIYDGGNPDLDGDIHVYSYDTGNIDFTSDTEMEPYNLMTIFDSFLDYGLPVMVSDNSGFESTDAG